MLQKTREEMGFTGNNEKTVMKTIVASAERNGRIGDKVLIVVPPMYVHVPRWQRKLDMYRAERIGLHYDKNKWEVPKMIYNNGILECVDGMHRIFGAYLGKVDGIVVEILNITEKEAIELFLNQTVDRNRMKPQDYLNASLQVEKPEYVEFKRICNKYNVQIKGDDSLNNPIGVFTPLTTGTSICKSDPETLDRILNIICKLNWNNLNAKNGNVFCADYIRIFKKLYAYYSDNIPEMEKILLDNCSGAEWFDSCARKLKQSQLFDYMSDLIKSNLAATENRSMLKAI